MRTDDDVLSRVTRSTGLEPLSKTTKTAFLSFILRTFLNALFIFHFFEGIIFFCRGVNKSGRKRADFSRSNSFANGTNIISLSFLASFAFLLKVERRRGEYGRRC